MTNNKNEDTPQVLSETAREEKVSELKILQQSLDEKKQLVDDYYQQILRLKADFENFRKRAEKEKQNYMIWGKEDILLKQIRLFDVMAQAKSSTLAGANIESIKKGIELIYQEFEKMLSDEGITEIECLDAKFDPALHEAVDNVESDKQEGTIVEVLQKGYRMNERIIRHSKVKVAKPKEENK